MSERRAFGRAEYISLGTLILLASWIFFAGSKVNAWDDAVNEIKDMKPKVIANEKSVAVIASRLDDIQDDLKYLKRHTP